MDDTKNISISKTSHLSETLPASLVDASWRNFIFVIGGPAALFCLSISISAFLHSGWQAALLLSLLFWLWAGLIVFGTASVLHHNLRTQIPTVELHEDELVVRYGERTLAAKVADCHLHQGLATSMRLSGGVKLYCRVPVILIDFPPFSYSLGLRRPSRNTAAVGFSNKMRDQWERVLRNVS